MNRRIERSEPILPSRHLAETRSFYEALGRFSGVNGCRLH